MTSTCPNPTTIPFGNFLHRFFLLFACICFNKKFWVYIKLMSCLKTSENNHTVPIMYEVIPPKADAKEEKIHAQVEKLLRGLEGKAISAINIPEILDGPAGGSPAINSPQKLEPR